MTTITLYASPRLCYSQQSLYPSDLKRKNISNVISLYPLRNYSVQHSEFVEPPNLCDYRRSLKLQRDYENDGMVRTLQAALLGHQHSIAQVFLLQTGRGRMLSSRLPGGKLYNGEDDVTGLKRLMAEVMGYEDSPGAVCKIEHVVANWWRPTYDSSIYPYVPSHITKPKELIRVYVVELPKRAIFTVAKNNMLVAAPMFEIYENVACYGPIIANLPHVLSQFNYLYN